MAEETTIAPPDAPAALHRAGDPPAGDYLVERGDPVDRPGFVARMLQLLRGLVLIVLALTSLALFWVAATLLGLS